MKFRKLAIEQLQDRVLMAGDIGVGSGMVDFGYGYDFVADSNDTIGVFMDWHVDFGTPPGFGDGGLDFSNVTLD